MPIRIAMSRDAAPNRHRALGICATGLLAGALLSACGAGHPAAGTGTPAGSGAAVSVAAGCQRGAAGTPDFTLAVPNEPDSGVAKYNSNCWAAIPFTTMPNVSTGSVPSQDTGQFKVAWNAQNLYILAWIQEWPLNADATQAYKNDTVEFYLAGDNNKGSDYGPNDCHYDITFNGAATAGSKCNLTGPMKTAAQVVQNKGYYAELTVPWSTLNVGKAAKGQQYAFTVQYDVADSGGNRVGQNQWAGGSNDDAGQTQNWGTITLN